MATTEYYRKKAEEHKALAEQARRGGHLAAEKDQLDRMRKYEDLAKKKEAEE